MKLKMNKKKIKNLSNDHKQLPEKMTPQVGGASGGGCAASNYLTCWKVR